MATAIFSPRALGRIQAETFVERIEFRDEIGSTNDLALEIAAQLEIESPLLVLAERQTSGRGRGDNGWWSAAGALTFSLLLKQFLAQLTPQCWPRISLTAALAVCEALEALSAGLKLDLKWPNDVYLQQRKLGGILVEIPSGSPRTLVVGIGLNINNSHTAAPGELSGQAISVLDATGTPLDLSDVLIAVLVNLEQKLSALADGSLRLSDHWRRRCILTGQRVQLEVGNRRVEGDCEGIDADGGLILQTETGPQTCYSGVVSGWHA